MTNRRMYQMCLIEKEKELAAGGPELDRYLDELTEDDSECSDILSWWKEKRYRFPVLSKMACDIFVVPVSRTASESTFRMGGYIHDSFGQMISEMSQVLMYTRDWLRPPDSLACVEDYIRDKEQLEKDLTENHSFGTSEA